MSDGILYPLDMAAEVYVQLRELLNEAVERIELAGSARRKKSYVHDIDVVVHAKYSPVGPMSLFELDDAPANMQPVALAACLGGIAVVKDNAKIVRFEYQRMPVELYITDQDGSNFDALLQMRTGSANFNASLASRARRLGMEYRAGYGLFTNGRRVDDGTERGIFSALHLPYLSPERRN